MVSVTIKTLIKKAKGYLPSLDEARLRRAYDFAQKAHQGQLRMNGIPYITHPLAAAVILTDFHLDEDALIACLLHDVPEDTEHGVEEIEEEFGKTIAFLVNGVTKLSKMKYRNNMMERQVDSLKKFFLHSAHDLRIILIKLGDRLHNLQTLEFVHDEKQIRVARETLEIYVPIANLLGIWGIKSQLEDLCFRYLYPNEWEEMRQKMSRLSSLNLRKIHSMEKKLEDALNGEGISAEISSRPKSLFSIFRKMVNNGRRFEDMNDLIGFRVIVENSNDCYRTLGVIHRTFPPKSGRIKDYIAVPKSNGYQSLHTTVFGMNGLVTEFQIRTPDMHYAAEYGIAAHYFYKNSQGNGVKASPKISHWMQKVLELQKEFKSNKDFLKNLKVDIFRDRIFVFTPKGDVFDLPEGAIGVDFAYHIHSDLGNRAIKIYRNGKLYPILSMLKNGETIEVISSETQTVPPREWLEKVKTNLAKRKIKESLKKQNIEHAYSEGILFLKKTFKRYGLPALNHLHKEQKDHLIHAFHSSHWRDFLVSVGNGTISQHEFIGALYTPEQILGKPHYHKELNYSPLPRLNHQMERGMISPSSIPAAPYYRITLIVKTVNRVGLLRDLGSQLSNLGINIHRISVRAQKGNRKEVLLDTVIEVIDLLQLENACDGIESIDGILEVARWVAPKKKSVPSST